MQISNFPATTYDQARINELARELAQFGFGICIPHRHAHDGQIESLPLNAIVLEQNLLISFVDQNDLPQNAIPVGWRWIDDRLQAFAACCGGDDPDPDPDPDPGE